MSTWAEISAAIALATWCDSVVISALCIVFIGTRQTVFGLLMHDQVHRLGIGGRYGDWIVNVLAVYPLLITTIEQYAQVHLAHHKYFMTSKDPDFTRKSGKEWTFPISGWQLLRIALTDVSGANTLRTIRGKTVRSHADEFRRPNATPSWARVLYFALVASAITVSGVWQQVLLYWIVPLATVGQLRIRWGAMCEHVYVEGAQVAESTPIVALPWWQRLLMPDLNFGLHVYHHFHPGVAFSELPKVHGIYSSDGLVDHTAVFYGHGQYFQYLLGRRQDSGAPILTPANGVSRR